MRIGLLRAEARRVFRNTRTFGASSLGTWFAVLGLIGCGTGNEPGKDTGIAVVALQTIPADVACLSIVAAGSRTVTRLQDVNAGAPAQFTIERLPLGNVRFSGNAYAVPCAQVGTPEPTWTADPVQASIVPGTPAQVGLSMHRTAGSARVAIDFVDDAGTSDGASFNCGTELAGAKLIVGVQTGGAIDVGAAAANGTDFPGGTLDGEWAIMTSPLGNFDLLPNTNTTSGDQPLPASLSVRTVLGRNGQVCAGVFGGTDAEALSVLTTVHDVFDNTPSCEWSNNYCRFDFTAGETHQVARPREWRLNAEVQNVGLASEVVYRYALAVNRGYVQGGPASFKDLYEERTWGFWSGYTQPITLGQSLVHYDCIYVGTPYTTALHSTWCPSPNEQCRVPSSRSFTIGYTGSSSMWLQAITANDNSTYTKVILDGVEEVAEGPVGSYWGDHHLFNTWPTRVRLEVNNPWSMSFAGVRFAVVGGTVAFSDVHEAANGVTDPAGSPDRNPPPQTVTLPPGWSLLSGG